MTIPVFWGESWTAALANHLWQSTVVVAVMWLLALALRKNYARVRYWVWFAASVKFLLPFSLLVGAGEWLRTQLAAPSDPQPMVVAAIGEVAQPFPQGESFGTAGVAAIAHGADPLATILVIVWSCGLLFVVYRWARAWWGVRTALRTAEPIEVAADVPVFSTTAPIEPGIFGVFRPVLLLPDGILARLTPTQFKAILTHELEHIRRRDNLTFAIHMIVEALFWFHPVVWWIGARLIDERERACDEAVVQACGEAQAYAEGILNVCKFYVELPLECVSGVTGSDLKRRIVRILTGRVTQKVNLSKKLLLGAAGVTALALPVIVGLVYTGRGLAQSQTGEAVAKLPEYEVVSIKPEKSDSSSLTLVKFPTDGLSIIGFPLRMLLPNVFRVANKQLLGEPGWADTDRFDIEAKVAAEDVPKLNSIKPNPRWAMLLPVLEDRFGLKFHHEARDLTQYVLVVSKGGLKMKEAIPGDTYPNGIKGPDGKSGSGLIRAGRGELTAQAVPISTLVGVLSFRFGSPVLDKTGLTGKYDFDLKWSPDEMEGPMLPMLRSPDRVHPGIDSPAPPAAAGPSIFTALEEQLGLKLESHKEPTDVIVIDHIEQPSPN